MIENGEFIVITCLGLVVDLLTVQPFDEYTVMPNLKHFPRGLKLAEMTINNQPTIRKPEEFWGHIRLFFINQYF